MAGASSSSSSGSHWNYDVFINFRGEDTRRGFVCHLYRDLKRKALHTFIDSEELGKGDDLSELLKAIQGSRLSLVVFSENYASSTWCLKELVQILKCMDNQNQIVVPIFYQVDPSDVRKLKASFGKAFAKHERDSAVDMEEMESWKSSLIRSTNLSGWASKNYQDDAKLMEDIVEDIFNKLSNISVIRDDGLVGMDSHINEMEMRLCPGVADVRFVGIWGMGGIGKTTIATAVYNKIEGQFEHCCFLENIKERFHATNGVIHTQEELLSRLLKEERRILGPLDKGLNMIRERLGKKKVLLVLDDVDNLDQSESLIGKKPSFGGGSRIIITTRDKHLLPGYAIYEPKSFTDDKALELFRQYAFRTNPPSRNYDDLSRRAIKYSHGLPLALKVFGAFLDNKSVHEWEDELEKIKKIPNRGIQGVLRTSFDGLDDSQKNIFLDIACFFRGYDKEVATKILDSSGFFPYSGLRVLVDRALITVSYYNTLEMHDLIQEMGWDIVNGDPRGPSRLWRSEDIYRVLSQNTEVMQDTGVVEGIVLDLSELKDLYINTEAFVSMKKLRLLQLNYDGIDMWEYYSTRICEQRMSGDLKFLSGELRFLVWDGCPIKSLSFNFDPKNLVHLEMPRSCIEQLWEGTKSKQPLQKLVRIDLSDSQYLIKTPDLTEATNLERLNLQRCVSLVEVHPSISALKNLAYLNLKGCKELKNFPSFIDMKSLEKLNLSGCSNLEKFRLEFSEDMKELKHLLLDETAITEITSSINNHLGLQTLSLRGCRELRSLPSSIHLESLQDLDLSVCSNLEKFPEISEDMKELKHLLLDGSAITVLPSSINNLSGLQTLSLRGCRELRSLPHSIHFKSLRELDLSGCSNLEKFPEISEDMKELTKLSLVETAITGLPSSINNLSGLQTLSLHGCRELRSLPSTIHLKSLQDLDLSGCSNLEEFPEISGERNELRCLNCSLFHLNLFHLNLEETAIKELPSSIEFLHVLVRLRMSNCRSLVLLPDNICKLAWLLELYLDGCSKLSNLPENLGDLKHLSLLRVEGSGIQQLPFSILRLINLEFVGCKEMTAPLSSWPTWIQENPSYSILVYLDLSDCNLLELSDAIAHLSSLESLKLCRNNKLQSLPTTMNRLVHLRNLYLEGCKTLKSIPELLSSIQCINASDCTDLKTVSTPNPPYFEKSYNIFLFYNCFQLVKTNLFTDIVETATENQANYPGRLFVSLPAGRDTKRRSDIPDWFNHQCRGSSVTVQLPPNWFPNRFLGLAICAIINLRGADNSTTLESALCLCTFKANDVDDEESFCFPLAKNLGRTNRLLESDHMFLQYQNFGSLGEWRNEGKYTEARFRIVTGDYGYIPNEDLQDYSGITSCGVRLFHVNSVDSFSVDLCDSERSKRKRETLQRERKRR